MTEYNFSDGKELPSPSELADLKLILTERIEKEVKGPEVSLVSLWGIIKIPKLIFFDLASEGSFKQEYKDSGINMGIYTLTFVSNADVRILGKGESYDVSSECIVYQSIIKGDMPDIYYDELLE